MKIFVFAYDRYDSMTTSKWLGTTDHIVLCHDQENRKRFLGQISLGVIVISTGNPRGLALQRNYALDKMQMGEWALFLNDDLANVTELYDL